MFVTRANVLLELGRVDEAIADCQKALKIKPDYMNAFTTHAKALAYKNKLGASFEMLKQAWVKDKENKNIKVLMDVLEKEI